MGNKANDRNYPKGQGRNCKMHGRAPSARLPRRRGNGRRKKIFATEQGKPELGEGEKYGSSMAQTKSGDFMTIFPLLYL